MITTSHNKKAFTLIELLIVMVIAGVLATVTLNMNRWRIQQMQNINERELRIDWHTHINREITNTNYFNNKRINSLEFNYLSWSQQVMLSGKLAWDISQSFDPFTFVYHTITSGSVSITKTPLQLGCEISWWNNTIYLQAKSDKIFCFEIKPSLCVRSLCN